MHGSLLTFLPCVAVFENMPWVQLFPQLRKARKSQIIDETKARVTDVPRAEQRCNVIRDAIDNGRIMNELFARNHAQWKKRTCPDRAVIKRLCKAFKANLIGTYVFTNNYSCREPESMCAAMIHVYKFL
jgi:hypothetical protein